MEYDDYHKILHAAFTKLQFRKLYDDPNRAKDDLMSEAIDDKQYNKRDLMRLSKLANGYVDMLMSGKLA